MEDGIGEYRPVQPKQFPARDIRETAEEKYWRRFKAPVVHQEIGAITHIDFSQEKPYHFAITASTRVIAYDGSSRKVRRTFARFKDKAYSGSLRQDGRLLVAGGEDGIVQVFEGDGRTILRQLKGHKKPVRVARFAPDKTHVLSAGDDATVRYWDITTGEQKRRLEGHSDYVRAAAVSPADSNLWATGGYDHKCILWDLEAGKARLSLDHGSPVEDLAFFPTGAMLATAGGAEVRVWDVLGGGRLVARLTNFQKTVTCVRLTPLAGPDSSASARLLAGSLDGHVRVFELSSYKLTHASKYPGPVLSLGLSGDCRTLAVGLADGTLTIRRHARKRPPGVAPGAPELRARRRQPRLDARNYRYFVRGTSEKAGPGDAVVASQRRAKLRPYDRFLRKFQHREALDAALATDDPTVVVAVLQELAARPNALASAIAGRDVSGLALLLHFVSRHVADPRYTHTVLPICQQVMDIYATEMGKSEIIHKAVTKLRLRIKEEVTLQASLGQLQGTLEPILAVSMGGQ